MALWFRSLNFYRPFSTITNKKELSCVKCKINVYFYNARSYDAQDEMCWGGVWMYLATQEPHYLQVRFINDS